MAKTTTSIVASLIYLTIFLRWTTNDIVTPVKELLYSMKRIGEGHLDSQAIVRTNDEIGELTEGCNQMASVLNNYIFRISRMNESYYRFVPIVATLEMRRVLIDFNELLESEEKKPVEFGTGIHTGNLMLGIVGCYGRMDGTVVSDAVNLASRIEGLTKLYVAAVIFSEDTLIKLKDPTI